MSFTDQIDQPDQPAMAPPDNEQKKILIAQQQAQQRPMVGPPPAAAVGPGAAPSAPVASSAPVIAPPSAAPVRPPAAQSSDAVQKVSTLAEQANPFAAIFARSSNIGNPYLRVLAKIGSMAGAVGYGAAASARPDLQEQRMKMLEADNAAPGNAAEQQSKIRLQDAQADEAENKQPKTPTPEEGAVASLQTKVDPATGANYTPEAAFAKVEGMKKENSKPGEFQEYSVPGSTVPIMGQQVGNKILDRTGNELPANATKYVKPVAEHPQAGTIAGKPAWGIFNPATKGFEDQAGNPLANFKPAPNYAEVAPGLQAQARKTQTKVMFGSDGKPHDFSWNEATGKFDMDQGFSAAGTPGSKEAQANVVQVAGRNLIQDITANKADLGTLTAFYKAHTLNVPYVGDPVLAELDSELRSFAALQPAMHGFRSTSALDTFEKIIGGLQKDPDAMIGSIRGILKTAGTMGTTPQGHSFTYDGKRYANVPDDVYEKYKGKPGFVDGR